MGWCRRSRHIASFWIFHTRPQAELNWTGERLTGLAQTANWNGNKIYKLQNSYQMNYLFLNIQNHRVGERVGRRKTCLPKVKVQYGSMLARWIENFKILQLKNLVVSLCGRENSSVLFGHQNWVYVCASYFNSSDRSRATETTNAKKVGYTSQIVV